MRQLHRLILLLAAAMFASALMAQEQGPNSEKHAIGVQTDSGRYGASSEQLDPKRLGVAIYPGARKDDSDHDNNGGNVSFDWGQVSLHLYAQQYLTPDAPDKVLAFYRKELAKYGKVLECRGNKPNVSVNSELKCEDSKDNRDDKSVELKAGTENKQHIVGVTPKGGGTEIGIVYFEKSGAK